MKALLGFLSLLFPESSLQTDISGDLTNRWINGCSDSESHVTGQELDPI